MPDQKVTSEQIEQARQAARLIGQGKLPTFAYENAIEAVCDAASAVEELVTRVEAATLQLANSPMHTELCADKAAMNEAVKEIRAALDGRGGEDA